METTRFNRQPIGCATIRRQDKINRFLRVSVRDVCVSCIGGSMAIWGAKKKLMAVAAAMLLAGVAKAPAAAASAAVGPTILPDSCGDNKVRFEVKEEKNPPRPSEPEAGKAQVVLIESFVHSGYSWGAPTTRVGMDGAWIGANHGNSYFTITVDPGEHHLCSDEAPGLGGPHSKIGLAKFTAEAGKVYYFETVVTFPVDSDGSPRHSGTAQLDLELKQVDEDEGKYRVKAFELSKWKAKS
jgi:hypothetical protein